MKTYLQTLVAVAVLFSSGLLAATGKDGEARIAVTTVTVTKGDVQHVVQVQALVESLNAPVVNSKVSAEVLEINVDEGDHVTQGEVLARLDGEGFRLDKEAAQADIARLQATLNNQLLTRKRDEQLFKKGLVPDTRLDASRTAVKQTRASIVHARALLKKAEYELSHTTVVAPVDGVIQQRLASVGDYLNPISPSSKPLFQIVDIEHLRARLFFPEKLAGIVSQGMSVTLKRRNERIKARITRLRPMVEEGTRSFIALADFNNRLAWPPGIRISADVLLEQRHDVPVIPEATLVQRPGGIVVYRLRDDQVEGVPVKTGVQQDGLVEVVSGLSAGDRLVLDGAAFLTDGVKVSVTTESTKAAQ